MQEPAAVAFITCMAPSEPATLPCGGAVRAVIVLVSRVGKAGSAPDGVTFATAIDDAFQIVHQVVGFPCGATSAHSLRRALPAPKKDVQV
jgi:hypothetical protein